MVHESFEIRLAKEVINWEDWLTLSSAWHLALELMSASGSDRGQCKAEETIN